MNPDAISRTALIAARDGGAATFADALASHATNTITLIADTAVLDSVAGEAALCTAVATAVRAFGTVTVITDDARRLTAGPHQGRTLGDMVTASGANLSTDPTAAVDGPILLIGATAAPSRGQSSKPDNVMVRATWTGWTAQVEPVPALEDLALREGNVLAAIAAAALGVHEAFGATRARPGSDAGHREVRLSLWHPGTDVDGPPLTYAPAAWWLVGLGHLGQAYAWVISWLTYADPSRVSIVLQDTDRAVRGNHSTGLFIPPEPAAVRKTRIVAEILDVIGYDTAVIERRLDRHSRVTDADHHVALLGVDNVPTRRLISNVGWTVAIDAGLGTGTTDFNAMLLRRFPSAHRSDEIPGWADTRSSAPVVPDVPAFRDLAHRDPCGVVALAGTAVGAAFVGVIAACLAVAEGLRDILGGRGFDVISLHLGTGDIASAPATSSVETIPARLANPRVSGNLEHGSAHGRHLGTSGGVVHARVDHTSSE